MTGKNADTVAVKDVPEAHGAIGRACGHVVGVGVEAGAGDVREMSSEYTQWLVVVSGPQPTERMIRSFNIWY